MAVARLSLPDDFRAFLAAGRQLEYDPRQCECGRVTLLRPRQLRLRPFTILTDEMQDVYLTPVPYDGGKSQREQGISKAGNKHVRCLMVELAWMWLRWQPGSVLSQWYERRFGAGNKRVRKVGIVALARKLLIALWRFVDRGELPEGAAEKDWRLNVNSTVRRHAKQTVAVAV
jgi:hypothetical protein